MLACRFEDSQQGHVIALQNLTFSSYRNLLNKWKLYFERVEFDLFWNKASAVQSSSGQVYLHCNYCNNSISHSQPRKFTRFILSSENNRLGNGSFEFLLVICIQKASYFCLLAF